MGFPLFRFTLNNTIAGELEISEPGGWDEAVLKLERNQEYHSLVEFYDQPLTFYGQSSEGNGGLDYIREIESSQGPDAQITILIEISDDGVNYSNVFNGLLDITSCKEVDFYKAEYGIIRDDFWQKFMNRKATPVDLGASVDLDGNAVVNYAPFTMTLPSQKIRKSYNGILRTAAIIQGPVAATDYLQVDMDEDVVSEILDKFAISTSTNTSIPVSIFTMQEDGVYTFDIRFEISYLYSSGSCTPPAGPTTLDQIIDSAEGILDLYFKINNGTPVLFTETNSPLIYVERSTQFTYSATHTLQKGDEITIYGDMLASVSALDENIWIHGVENTGEIILQGGWSLPTCSPIYGSSVETIVPPSAETTPTYLNVTADTTYPETTTEAYDIFDAGASTLSKITGQNYPLTSEYLESQYGCGGHYALMKGLNIRGYSFTDKPFTMTFETYWQGIAPILNLGLGYTDGATQYIEIEPKSEFYDPVPVINFDYVNNIERSYSPKHIFKTVEIGYAKWSAESGSGIDDPQSKRTYQTRFKTVGEDLKVLSKFYAASLGIEQTRRNRVELGRDWRLDDDVMIIALNKNNVTLPETGSDFSSVTGLLNSDTRYNIRISCARNLQRWLDYLNGCLKWYTTNDDISFASGEGNYDMTSTLSATDCEGDGITVDEGGDFDAGAGHDFLFVPVVYSFEYPLTWAEYKAMRDNRKKAIGVSRTNSDHVACFILNLEYEVTRGKAKFTVILGQEIEL